METEASWLRELRSPPGEGALRGGWRQLGAGFRLLRRDRTILALTLAGALAFLLLSIGIFYLERQGGPPARDGDRIFRQLLFSSLSLALVLLMSLGIACAADARIDGTAGGFHLVLGEVRERLPALLGWYAISLVAGIGLGLVAYLLLSPVLTFWVIGLLWGIGTMFVIPALAIEGGGTLAAVGLGLRLLRASWGRALVAFLLLVCFYVVVLIPIVSLLRSGSDRHALGQGSEPRFHLGGIALFYLVTAMMLAVREGFALIRARDVLDDLPGEPRPRVERERGRLSIRRVVLSAVGLMVLLFLLGTILGWGGHGRSPSTSVRQPATEVHPPPSIGALEELDSRPGDAAASRRTFETRPTGEWVATGRVLLATRVNGRTVGEVLHRRWRFVTSCAEGPCRGYLLRTSSTGIESSPMLFRPHNYLAEFGNLGTTCETRPGWFKTFSVTFSIWWTKHRTRLVAEEMGGFDGGPACPYAGERIRWTAHPAANSNSRLA